MRITRDYLFVDLQMVLNSLTSRFLLVSCRYLYSRVDTDVLMEVAYSCNFLAVSDSSTCPDIGTS